MNLYSREITEVKKRAIVFGLLILVSVLLLSAGSCKPEPMRPRGEVPGSNLVHHERVAPTTYKTGEWVQVALFFTNYASEPRIMSPFPPKINIELPNVQPPDSVVRSIPAGTQEVPLEPGQIVVHIFTWGQKDDSGQQVNPGWYGVEVTTVTRKLSGTMEGWVRGWATKVLILPPQGVMEKTIEIEKAQTVDGITITLNRIELTASEMKVYAFNTPPGYMPPQAPGFPPRSDIIPAEAEYSLDGGNIKKTGPSARRFLENGTKHTWDNLDPVPSDARELTFTITKLGDWEGPWEFHILLEE